MLTCFGSAQVGRQSIQAKPNQRVASLAPFAFLTRIMRDDAPPPPPSRGKRRLAALLAWFPFSPLPACCSSRALPPT